MRIVEGHRSGAANEDVTNDAHVGVRWRLQPVQPSQSEVLARVVGPDSEGDRVDPRVHELRDVDVVPPVEAGSRTRVGDAAAVEVDVGGGDHAAEVQVGTGPGAGENEVAAIPPRYGELARRDALLIRGVERVGVGAVGDESGQHGGAAGGSVPADRREAG